MIHTTWDDYLFCMGGSGAAPPSPEVWATGRGRGGLLEVSGGSGWSGDQGGLEGKPLGNGKQQ